MSTHPTVFVTVPKYVAITPNETAAGSTVTTVSSTALPKIRPAPALTIVEENASSTEESSAETQPTKAKKRRLDHLTWEEKVQRKKLKNRVAAQTSRDRKKARMEEMDNEIQDLTERTEILVNKCESLQAINDSLLAKNQKLDMEVEKLRQQLQEIQQQQQQQQLQKTVSCAGSGLKPQGPTVDTGDNHRVKVEATAQKISNSIVSIACNSPMPSLQDILLPDIEVDEGALDDAEFDAGKLEELAESLLADITADLEASDRKSNSSDAEITSGTERFFGSMVGSTAECLEPGQHKTDHNDSSLKPLTTENSNNSLQTPELTLETKLEEETFVDLENDTQTSPHLNISNTRLTALTRTISPEILTSVTVTPETVYGTYDAKTNSITIVMDDVAVPVSEAVEEIYCDGAASANSTDEVICTESMASPSHVYLNVSTCSDDEAEDDFNFDPIQKFLCPKRPLVSPLAKSPAPSVHSATSDHGYESIIGSPSPPSHHFEPFNEDLNIDDFNLWPPGFNELFPSLI